jgi:sugar phosphate isomerase/epimerase
MTLFFKEAMMYYTGFADEAGAAIDVQIQATQELGWSNIESRGIDGVNLTDISDAKFEEVVEKLTVTGVKINCFGSAIANWSRNPRNDEDFQYSLEALRRAIPRMQRLGTTMLRGMSFAVAKDEEPDSPELEQVIFAKVKHLVNLCADAGVLYLHENCMNYGGMSHQHTLKLLDNIQSPNFKLVFDTGNPIFTDRRIGSPPYRKQSAWEFYANVKEFIHYVHIKDGYYLGETGGISPKTDYTFPGEGKGDVEKIVKDLLQSGYDGGFSIEPHLAVVFHDETVKSEDEVRYRNYVEYGRRFMKLVEKVQADLGVAQK